MYIKTKLAVQMNIKHEIPIVIISYMNTVRQFYNFGGRNMATKKEHFCSESRRETAIHWC